MPVSARSGPPAAQEASARPARNRSSWPPCGRPSRPAPPPFPEACWRAAPHAWPGDRRRPCCARPRRAPSPRPSSASSPRARPSSRRAWKAGPRAERGWWWAPRAARTARPKPAPRARPAPAPRGRDREAAPSRGSSSPASRPSWPPSAPASRPWPPRACAASRRPRPASPQPSPGAFAPCRSRSEQRGRPCRRWAELPEGGPTGSVGPAAQAWWRACRGRGNRGGRRCWGRRSRGRRDTGRRRRLGRLGPAGPGGCAGWPAPSAGAGLLLRVLLATSQPERRHRGNRLTPRGPTLARPLSRR